MGNTCCTPKAKSNQVTISRFTYIRGIGKGAFGRVAIVERKSDKMQFALKYANKDKLIVDKSVAHIIRERNILEEVDSEFICNLRYSFQDRENLYMVLDLKSGGDLRFHMKSPMREEAARIVIAEIALAITYLHSHQIIHRDVKPDNILLDLKGHVCLADFNTAVKFNPEKPLKTIAGTEPYMSPELLKGDGYLQEVDWWSLGVCLFEMIFNDRPFKGKNKRDKIRRGHYVIPDIVPQRKSSATNTSPGVRDHGGMRNSTTSASGVHGSVNFGTGSGNYSEKESKAVSTACREFISGLMEVNIENRLGNGPNNLKLLKEHAFMKEIDWIALENKEVVPILKPNVKGDNFEIKVSFGDLFPDSKNKKINELPAHYIKEKLVSMEKDFLYFDYENPPNRKPPDSNIPEKESASAKNLALPLEIPGTTPLQSSGSSLCIPRSFQTGPLSSNRLYPPSTDFSQAQSPVISPKLSPGTAYEPQSPCNPSEGGIVLAVPSVFSNQISSKTN